MSAPLFSIITVTYNAQSQLPATLASVAAQTCTDYEHIIIDGASTDSTVKIARKHAESHPTKIFSEPDNGLYDAMNKGIDRATGEYLIFLNAGDTFHSSDTLSLIAKTIADNNKPGIVYGQTEIVDSSRSTRIPRHLTAPQHLTYKSFAQGMVVCHQAFIVLARIASPFDLRYRYSADYEWCIRCLQHSRHNVLIDEPLVDYLNEGVSTVNRKKSLIERFRIMSRYYGTVPTILRHLKFVPRYLKRKNLEEKTF